MRSELSSHAMKYGLRPIRTVRQVAKLMRVSRGTVFMTERAALRKIKFRMKEGTKYDN
jgi:hypothetical protein